MRHKQSLDTLMKALLIKLTKYKKSFIITTAVLIFIFGIVPTLYTSKYIWQWTGIGQDSNKYITVEQEINPKTKEVIKITKKETDSIQSPKTLWDWLGLAGTLAIPIVLFQFQASEQRRSEKRVKVEKEQAEELVRVEKEQTEKREKFEKNIAEANLREEAFQTYIDRMAEILINKTSRSELFPDKNSSSSKDNSVRDVARIRTVTILRRLENDVERQNRILHFLHDTELFQSANLSGINLSSVNLDGANLKGANFTNTNLCGANLGEANLKGANFTNANLKGANLENANIQDTKFINADLSNARLVNAKTWYEEEIDWNCENVYVEEDYDYGYPAGYQERWYKTDFSGAKLTNANLYWTNFKAEKNLTVEQLKQAKNWDEAIYKNELFKKLGLPTALQSIIKNMRFNEDINFEVEIEKLIGYQVEVRNYINSETKTIIRGEITGFNKSKRRVNVKTSNGEQLDKLDLSDVYIYMV